MHEKHEKLAEKRKNGVKNAKNRLLGHVEAVLDRKWTRILANGEVGGENGLKMVLKMVGMAVLGLEWRVPAWGTAERRCGSRNSVNRISLF